LSVAEKLENASKITTQTLLKNTFSSPEYFSAEKFLPARLFTGSAMRQKTLSQRFLILVVMLEKEKASILLDAL
jgi:hypothetical protein